MQYRTIGLIVPTHGHRLRYHQQARNIPIVDDLHHIIMWTPATPKICGTEIRHPAAEALLGGPIDCAYVDLTDREDAIAAGAPINWSGPWRCLAIVRHGMGAQSGPVIERALSRRP